MKIYNFFEMSHMMILRSNIGFIKFKISCNTISYIINAQYLKYIMCTVFSVNDLRRTLSLSINETIYL